MATVLVATGLVATDLFATGLVATGLFGNRPCCNSPYGNRPCGNIPFVNRPCGNRPSDNNLSDNNLSDNNLRAVDLKAIGSWQLEELFFCMAGENNFLYLVALSLSLSLWVSGEGLARILDSISAAGPPPHPQASGTWKSSKILTEGGEGSPAELMKGGSLYRPKAGGGAYSLGLYLVGRMSGS